MARPPVVPRLCRVSIREHLRAIAYGEQLAHEDELIDLFQQHAVAALAELDAAVRPRSLNHFDDHIDISEYVHIHDPQPSRGETAGDAT